MMIELKEDVRVPERNLFVTVKAGSKVNYHNERRGEHMVHKFWHPTNLYGTLLYTCVTESWANPSWL